MHVLLIPSWYPSKNQAFNGNFIQRHATLISQNYKVTVLNFVSENIKNTLIESSENGNLNEITIYYPKKNNKIFQLISLRKVFLEVVKQIKEVDIIHGHVILEKGIIFIWAKKFFKKPLFVTEHGSYFFRENYSNLSVFQKMTIIQTMKNCDHISCVSEVLKDEISYLFPRKKIQITPNSIDTELFNTEENELVNKSKIHFIHISTLDNVKNPLKIIQAFELLNKQSKIDFSLKIIAEKTNLEISLYLQKSEIKEKISLVGPLEIKQVAEELKKSDALVLFSNFETFSCVIAEAWSCGVPVISSNVGIAKDMSPDLGILVEKMEIESLTFALKQFIESRKVYDKQKIRNHALQFSNENVLKSFDDFYSLRK